MAKQALGKGLGALINNSGRKLTDPDSSGNASALSGETKASVREVPIEKVRPSPLQPRTHFVEGELDELMESIRHHGVIQPLIVRPVDGELELIAGERRWRASKKVGLKVVPIIEREASDREVLEMALIENLQRADLNPIEEATGYVRLAREFGLKQEEIAKTVGKSRASVANSMRLLDLHKDVQPLVAQGAISVGHAKAILSIKDGKAQKVAAQEIMRRKLTVRATEKLIQDFHRDTKGEQRKSRAKNEISPETAALYRQIQSRLRSKLSTQVGISPGAKKGRIEIEYYGDDDLSRILEILGISID
ncbi:ParB/RepB/Spo0J family partition protein [Roseibacillus ishigakijimensis]|uniref:ParB/RepB/Spo0J family partition protein n=1 Tax=Roseibacillus ishigakijimensis TaxID=454146 RepID=A0A934VL09_9BACT|nr:ParB/RepB/Spo0J family partition protein [Roseibacillus ishigakijimensis]MBK1832636.1 ParB/RepB/Spo0J family partition protein [Roseibacillus ishigakijimensis]